MLLLALLLATDLVTLARPGLDAIRADALSAHVRFLADDLLEGRGTGSRGHAIAARYVASQLQAAGFAPAGEGGSWFQTVPMLGWTVDASKSAVELDGRALEYGKEMIVRPPAGTAGAEVEGELFFAGYGVSAKPLGYDDVPSDLKGKIAVVLYGAPAFPDVAARAVYSDSLEKAKLLAARGAIGVITVLTPEISKHLPFAFFVRQAAFEMMTWREGAKAGSGSPLPSAIVPAELLQRLLAKSGHDAAQVLAEGSAARLRPFALGLRGHLRVAAQVRSFTSENVVGILRGQTAESVLLSAHLDHLGIGAAIAGDAIYNGAGDNASGCAAVLEQARAFSALRTPLRRSVIALFVTGEEKNLIGSDYFAGHPTVPVESIVADVNIDGAEWRWLPHDLIFLGAEHSTLMRAAQAASAPLGLSISADNEPEQVFFIRSDQYSFVRRGIPSVFPSAGWKDERGGVETNKAIDGRWTKERYHRPGDEWDPSWSGENMLPLTRAGFLLALSIAIDPQRPRWNPGDVFEKMFGWNGPGQKN